MKSKLLITGLLLSVLAVSAWAMPPYKADLKTNAGNATWTWTGTGADTSVAIGVPTSNGFAYTHYTVVLEKLASDAIQVTKYMAMQGSYDGTNWVSSIDSFLTGTALAADSDAVITVQASKSAALLGWYPYYRFILRAGTAGDTVQFKIHLYLTNIYKN